MGWTSRRLLIAAALALAFATEGSPQSCSCARTQYAAPCAAYWRADAVFVGRADAIAGSGDARAVRFTVLESFLGPPTPAVDVAVGSARARCGSDAYRPGREYLVYAVRDARGRLTVAPCDRVRPVEDAAGDLSYARSVKDGTAPGGTIGGQVVAARRDLAGRRLGSTVPVKGLPVRVEREAAAEAVANPQDTVLTNEGGDFSVAARGAGRYVITPDLRSRYFLDAGIPPIELRDRRACAAIDLVVHENGRVAGRVVDAAGRPVEGLTVDLSTPTLAQRVRTITDRSGLYEFARVPSGRFVVGIDLVALGAGAPSAARHPRVFFPGVEKASAAARVAVARGDRVVLADFTLPAYVSLVTVVGFVIDADGTPAEGARVYLKSGSEDSRILAEPAVADFLGRFTLSLVSGGEYLVFAERARGTRVDSSLPTRLRAARTAPLKLVLQRRY